METNEQQELTKEEKTLLISGVNNKYELGEI